MQDTLMNRKFKNLPVVLSLKKVKFLLYAIAWIPNRKFKRLTGRLMWRLREREINHFKLFLWKRCLVTEACFSITTISTRIFTYSMSTLIHVIQQSLSNCSVIGSQMNTAQRKFKYSTLFSIVPISCFNTTQWSTRPSFRFTAEPLPKLYSLQNVPPLQNAGKTWPLDEWNLFSSDKSCFSRFRRRLHNPVTWNTAVRLEQISPWNRHSKLTRQARHEVYQHGTP